MQEPFTPVRLPCDANTRGNIVVIRVPDLSAVFKLIKEGRRAGQCSRLENITKAGLAVHRIEGSKRIGVIRRNERALNLPSEAAGDSQVGSDLPGILAKKAILLLFR